MKKFLAKLSSKKGQGMIEYVIIMALLVIAAIGVLTALGKTMKNKFNTVQEELENANNDD